MNVDWAPLQKAIEPLWKQAKMLFAEHHFLTILCGFFAVLMIISFYKFLRSISPALVGFVLALMLAILLMHWVQTRTEPEFLKPFVDFLAPFFPDVPAATPPPPKR
jgi:membrane glycosyltransferase